MKGVSSINSASDKQETINRMINRQYDQLLEMCEKSASEIEYIKQNLLNDDSEQQLEIEKTEALISSIVHDINEKKKEMQNLALKNRYDQLMDLYQKTQDEVQMLETNLEKDMSVLEESKLEIFTHQKTDMLDLDEFLNEKTELLETPSELSNHFGNKKKERLNLTATVDSFTAEEEKGENITDKWHESLAKIDEIEKEQFIKDLSLPPVPTDETSKSATETVSDFELPELPELPELNEIEIKGELSEKKKSKQSHRKFSGLKMVLNIMFYLILIGSIFFTFIFGMDNHNHTSGAVPSRFFGYSVMRVATGSMSPGLRINTVIVTRYVEASELRINDVVTFATEDNRTITHRIYHIYENYQNSGVYGFRLIGDANDGIADDIVYLADELIGRVVFQNYPLGRILMFTHHYFLTIMAVLVLSFVLLLVFKVRIKFFKKSRQVEIST